MIRTLFLVFLTVAAGSAPAQQPQDALAPGDTGLIRTADSVETGEFLWVKRILVIFANTPADPRYIQQMEYITARLDVLDERDVVVITDTDPAARSELRQRLRPRDFTMVLIGKDDTVYLRKPSPWRVREITRSID